MSSSASCSMTSTTSSTVTTPTSRWFSSTTGADLEIVALELAGDLFLILGREHDVTVRCP